MQFYEYDIECIEKARKLIDADISSHTTIAALAMKSGLGESKLKAGFKKFYGSSPYAYLRQQRMIKAAGMILESRKSMKQIAKATGFRHTNNFITAFSAFYHITPHRYRQQKLPGK